MKRGRPLEGGGHVGGWACSPSDFHAEDRTCVQLMYNFIINCDIALTLTTPLSLYADIVENHQHWSSILSNSGNIADFITLHISCWSS